MLVEQGDEEPESVLFVLLQVNEHRSRDEVHPLSVADSLCVVPIALVYRGRRQDPMKFNLTRLVFLKVFEVREGTSDVLIYLGQGSASLSCVLLCD